METHNYAGKLNLRTELKTSSDMVETMKTLESRRAQKNNQSERIRLLIQSTWSQNYCPTPTGASDTFSIFYIFT